MTTRMKISSQVAVVHITRAPAPRVRVQAGGLRGPKGDPGKPGAVWETFQFSQPSMVWLITHNRGVVRFAFNAYDQDGELQIVSPQILSPNQFMLRWDEPISGHVDVAFEG